MKKTLLYLIVILSILLFSCGETIIVKDVKGDTLEELNVEGKKDSILIIDVRPYDEYIKGHLPHSINIPINKIKYRKKEFEDRKDTPIYVYSENNDDSFNAAAVLVRYGCKEVYNAEGLQQYSYIIIDYDCVRGVKFAEMIKENNVTIVDCRTEKLYNLGHITGAISVPLLELENNLNKIPKDKKVMLYCNIGTASARAATILRKKGYQDVCSTIDGINEYKFKLVKN